MASQISPIARGNAPPSPEMPPSWWTQTAEKITQFFTSLEGIVSVFSVLAGVGVAILWGVSFGLLAAGVGLSASLAISLCRPQETPIPPYDPNAVVSPLESYLAHLAADPEAERTIIFVYVDGLSNEADWHLEQARKCLESLNASDRIKARSMSFEELKANPLEKEVIYLPTVTLDVRSCDFWRPTHHRGNYNLARFFFTDGSRVPNARLVFAPASSFGAEGTYLNDRFIIEQLVEPAKQGDDFSGKCDFPEPWLRLVYNRSLFEN